MGLHITPLTWRAPLQGFNRWLARSAPALWHLIGTDRSAYPSDTRQPLTAGQASPHHPVSALHAPRTCRVRQVHYTDTASGRCTQTRLVISGRISDVCAELDRLAAREHAGLKA
ncbi:MAG: hypothetical protein RLZZ352_929 [Pseudomonadota bacterium]